MDNKTRRMAKPAKARKSVVIQGSSVPAVNVENVDKRRKLNYFGHKDDGSCTLNLRSMKIPTFIYNSEMPVEFRTKYDEEASKAVIFRKLKICCNYDYNKFLIAPERKNVWMAGIRSECEGVLTAKSYLSSDRDRGAYTVIPRIEESRVTVEAVYKMWLSLECAMIRREGLIIVEEPALAQVTKLRTEQALLMNSFTRWGTYVSIFFSAFFRRYTSLHALPLCLAYYGYQMLKTMNQRDPASRYTECCINKMYELDPDSHTVCDAQISLRYLRCPQYRMFKLEDYKGRNDTNKLLIGLALGMATLCLFRNAYNLDYAHKVIRRGFDIPDPTKALPINIFKQLIRRFLTFGNSPDPGRVDLVHWTIQNGLFYYFFVRHIPRMIQLCLEYLEREHVMETSIRYLQFRNLQGEERYEFAARNLYRTMQKDFPNNRILKEMYDHYEQPPPGYYESKDFLDTREQHDVSLLEALRRWKISYYRNW